MADANLVYNFADWFAMSAGYQCWYFKHEDDGANLREWERKVHGPTIGVQFKF